VMTVEAPDVAADRPRAEGEAGAGARILRVGLMGFGRTGRDVARLVLREESMSLEWVIRRSVPSEESSAPVLLGIDSDGPGRVHAASRTTAAQLLRESRVDVIIDFSSESGLDYYGEAAAELGVTIVTAISGYSPVRRRQLERLARSTPVRWSPNITLGINFLLAAQTLQRIVPEVDVQIVEEHFCEKEGVSGTALRLARALHLTDADVHVIRAGGIIGVHEVLFGLPEQTVRLRHEAISREAFGGGAIFAACDLVGRDPGLYRMEDLLLPYFSDAQSLTPPFARKRSGVRAWLAERLRSAADLVG
jgi:4-hydroxy-tetrahydrodipicolinate reductase